MTRYNYLCRSIALATHLGLDTDEVDIKLAFLNEDPVEVIGMIPPPGIGLDGMILQLDKALHDLKQAPLAWFEKLSGALSEIGFISLTFDLFVFISADHNMIIVVYVYDSTTAGSRSHINRLIDFLRSRFKLTVNGSVGYILRIKIRYTPEGMELSQHQYIMNILPHFGMEPCRPVLTLIDTITSLVKASDSYPVFVQNL